MSIAKILYSQVVFMDYMLKALVTPIDGIRIGLNIAQINRYYYISLGVMGI